MSEKYDNQNTFMKIIRKELNASYVYEDKMSIAIMDIMPECPGHVLVIPKCATKDIFDVPKEYLNQIMIVCQKIALACKKAFQADGIKIMQLNGYAAGQTIPHLHFHIIPCKNGEENSTSPKKIVSIEKLEINAKMIRNELSTNQKSNIV
ncbi:HIT family protein [Candidatus Liberibacter americanus]|uniref:Diadenosine tetraphosphate n=1 Tax=Candidatus Liberibacter americanus str. Sao Paulo TaxID=1261131 RepID=U6B3B8_9HYPH|nr:HIT family protein [Candidatus Liberibacter americanus]AHA27554.1 Diadenosine tetraphosphate [Candidatus Liberibacter americanus str. Sao Paulo]EMS36485.1 histidine triad (HIT) protein [Candidatus Liberibacter americanus PW_SP]